MTPCSMPPMCTSKGAVSAQATSRSAKAPRGNILLVEDDARFRGHLGELLRAEGWHVAEVAGIKEAAERLTSSPWDLALIDLNLPDGDGRDVIDIAARQSPPVPSLVVTIYGEDALGRSALVRGASGYLLKDDSGFEYARAIAAVLEGGTPLSPKVARPLVDALRSPAQRVDDSLELLTRRERQVMALLGCGHLYEDVAEELGVALGTVQSYGKSLYGKLKVHSKAEVARLAAQWKDRL